MPRNGSGVMSVTNTFSASTTIASAAMNANFTDFASEVTASLPRNGEAGMSGQFKAASGTVGSPGISFSSDTDCGYYRIGADNMGFALAGAKVVDYAASLVGFTPKIRSASTVGSGGNDYIGLTSGGTGAITAYGGYDNLNVHGADVASASTLNLDSATGVLVDVTGTTTITAVALAEGRERVVRFTGALTFTHGASLVLPTAANITTEAGDYAILRGYAAGVVRCVGYFRASGRGLAPGVASSPPIQFSKLIVTVTGNAAATVTADYVSLWDSSSNVQVVSAVSLTLDATGTGANKLDTGALANSTWYYIFVIYNPSTATTACLLSTSATAPTMPSGYTYKARVGAMITDGSANIMRTIQRGRTAQYVVGSNPATPRKMMTGVSGNVVTPTWTAITAATYVPPTAAEISVTVAGIATNTYIIFAPNNSYGGVTSTTNLPPFQIGIPTGGAPSTIHGRMVLEGNSVYGASGGGNSYIACTGWVDNL